MSNMVRGIVTERLESEEYTFRLGVNEWCSLEDEMGKSLVEIQKDLSASSETGSISMLTIRSFFRAMLSHSRPGISPDAAGTIMDAFGLQKSTEIVFRVITASLPEASGDSKKKKMTKLPA